MEPARKMIPSFLPTIIRETCEEFVSNYNERQMEILPEKLEHDRSWKEEEEILAGVTKRILGVLSDTWNNPAFGPEFIELQGTYITNIIVPTIHAVLKDLPFGKSSYVSTSEKQSIASADRRGEGYSGRRPDIMFVLKHGEYIYELIYAECSRLLWREVNDGIFWTRKGCYPDKDKFGIIGIQVAGMFSFSYYTFHHLTMSHTKIGCKLHLNVLVRDSGDIHRYYHLKSAEIPVQQSEEDVVAEFIETLLILRNILVVNMSLIFHTQVPRSRRRMEKSSTVSSDPE
ncbi:hypothetical protein C1645_763963 [Glomus cerebriforme]|uniref:Uncharacterized protein n=1 Tax=Glomus cerebriforme TaxID=658196 RepID=A0A397TCY4_9GLOM|nr:hypothetical protein C1645_763963 [Glomus cerebriforme]